ncbi:hypothetical protein GOP47_0015319 [Adiantum capillus-veneris]|uniref:Uncharacterized protein n=1 Tax=Adiantum capillus-veneris TaxID=13818 RepID=A0A9D4UKF5_ADICA|nr:hypothetical protein GOP47_0015319 [Adiantum capillus-veneris]
MLFGGLRRIGISLQDFATMVYVAGGVQFSCLLWDAMHPERAFMGPFEEPHRGDESIHFLFNSLCNGMEVEIQSAYETLLALLQNVLQHRSALSKRKAPRA